MFAVEAEAPGGGMNAWMDGGDAIRRCDLALTDDASAGTSRKHESCRHHRGGERMVSEVGRKAVTPH